jgi:poly(3-hydroxybutyrate) depolymerase
MVSSQALFPLFPFGSLFAVSALGATRVDVDRTGGLIRRDSRVTTLAAGCASGAQVQRGEVFNRTLLWREEGLPSVLRQYSVYVPESYERGKPSGLVLVFHGWGDPSSEKLDGMGQWPKPYHNFYGYRRAADSSGFITVYPVGLSDCQGKDCSDNSSNVGYASWNGAGTTSSEDSGKVTCDRNVSRGDYCYSSTAARKGGKCHACDWTTGYNDVAFVRQLVDELKSTLCIDTSRVFATGCSNGGMFVHELAQQMSDTFAAVAANCAGKPHQGFEAMPGGHPVSMMLVTGESDRTIQGFKDSVGQDWWDGFKYASRSEVFEDYRLRNGCPANMDSKFYMTMGAVDRLQRGHGQDDGSAFVQDGSSGSSRESGEAAYRQHSMSCHQLYYGCAGNSSLVSCEWDGAHDIMKGEPSAAYAFFAEHPRI